MPKLAGKVAVVTGASEVEVKRVHVRKDFVTRGHYIAPGKGTR
jgi:hypothetical protein